MSKPTDVHTTDARLYFHRVEMRVPLKFGTAVMTHVTYARVALEVADDTGRRATGWGETPLSVGWAWPSACPYDEREEALKAFCVALTTVYAGLATAGHPIELGHACLTEALPAARTAFNEGRSEPVPLLASLVCASAFDVALHDAYGRLHGLPVYDTYGPEHMNTDLAALLAPADDVRVSFSGLYPADFLASPRHDRLPVWHLVGGLDKLTPDERDASDPDDGYPVALTEWIETDGLRCLKIKLRGNDAAWDYQRLVHVGRLGERRGVNWLSADFNCTVTDPAYVTEILDRLMADEPRIYGMLLYVEQPFPYELTEHPIDVHPVSARKPLFLDESAHDWEHVRLGRSLGWTGVALKTCKTQTGALLSLCWAKAHGMTLMVQDLTNAMLAMIPHAQLAAHAGTIMGVEANGMQFHPAASTPEEAVHPGLYRRRGGQLDLSSVRGPGFGYQLESIQRDLPEPAAVSSAET